MTPRLLLHHEFLLLALHDKKGTLSFGRMQHIGLAGGVFAELLLADRVRIVTERRRRRDRELVELIDPSPTGEMVLDAALTRLREAKRRASPSHTVSRLARIKRFRHEVGRELVRRGVVRGTEEQVLLWFSRKVYPTLDPAPERALVERIRSALADDRSEIDGRTAMIIALAHPTGVLRAIYDRKELKALKPRIESVADRAGGAAEAAQAAIRAATAAVTAATAAAAAAAAAG